MNPITYNTIMEAYTPEQWAEFAFFSANVQHVLGEHDLLAQLSLYHRYLDYSEWQAGLDLCTGTASACSALLTRSIDEGAMLVTFHYGRYRLIPLSLMAQGYRVCILVSRDVYTEQREYYRKHIPADWFANLVFVIAEDPRLFFQLRRYRHAGYVLICYADGASGVKKPAESASEGVTKVRLGRATIAARSGFAAMAYLLRSPIVFMLAPITCMGQDGILDGIEAYYPIQHRSRADFVQQVMRGVYTMLSGVLTECPECWECWTHVHEQMPIDTDSIQWSPEIRYIPFENKVGEFLLDKADYAIYRVDKNKFTRLKQASVFAY